MKHDDELVKLIYESWEKDRAERGGDLREHLGASVIGRECDREIWYGFRWFKDNLFDGRMLRLFDRGRREEPVVLVDLMAAGLKFDYSTEEQPSFSDHGGHFRGSADAVGLVGRKVVLVEIKTAGDKPWNDLHRKGVAESKPEHFCQMQVYMGQLKIEKGLYVSVNKNDDQIHAEWIDFDQATFDALRQRAKEIIFSASPPDKLSDNPANFKCKLCGMWGVCHGGEAPAKNCRTCTYSSALEDGGWNCAKHNRILDKKAQTAGCDDWKNVGETPF